MNNWHRFPLLCNLARRDLAVLGSQAAVERFFSKSGLLVSKLRTSMKPSTVARLVLLMCNHHLIPDIL